MGNIILTPDAQWILGGVLLTLILLILHQMRIIDRQSMRIAYMSDTASKVGNDTEQGKKYLILLEEARKEDRKHIGWQFAELKRMTKWRTEAHKIIRGVVSNDDYIVGKAIAFLQEDDNNED